MATGTTRREAVVIIGAGQAGLAVSHELSRHGVGHVVLERGRVGQSWRDRWDSFCLVLPNWTLRLPGHAYDGDQPDAFMPRDEVVRYLERYAAKTTGALREGVAVSSVEPAAGGGFVLRTADGDLEAAQVVVATGAYQRPHRPPGAATLPAGLRVLDADDYTNPADLPVGGVLVVGSGQTGCQIAEELHDAGRATWLSCGKAPWVPRRIGDHDALVWMERCGFFEMTAPSPAIRLAGNGQVTGKDGGHDLHYRTLQARGVTLLGRFTHADAERVWFADDLAASVAFGDARYGDLRNRLVEYCREQDLPPLDLPDPPPFVADAPTSLDLRELGAVVFTSGFRPDYASWVKLAAFDDLGFPVHQDGASPTYPGLYFVGVHFLRKRKSSLFLGVGEDAVLVARQIADRPTR